MAEEVGALRVDLSLDTADFSKAMQTINRGIRGLEAEFKNASVGMDKYNKTLDDLSLESGYLNEKLDLQKKKVDNLGREYNALVAARGKDSKEAQNAYIQYQRAEEQMKRTQQQLKKVTDQIERQSGTWSKLQDNMNKISGRMQNLGQNMQTAGSNIALAFGAATAALGAGLASGVSAAASFEAQLSSIKAVTGATSEEMKTLADLAVQYGSSTKYSSLEAAQGIEELIKAGVSMEDIVNGGLEGALSLATAGSLDLAQAAEIASTALNAFEADQLTVNDAANILAGGANASATSVGELQFGLSRVSAVAAGVGLSFRDTATALSLFSNNGLKGSDAGTSLKTMLSNLIPKSKEAAAQMEELGLLTETGSSAFFDAQGNIKSMADIAELLKQSLVGLNAEQRQQALYTMFGSDAIRAANILFKEGAAGINNLTAEMSKVTAADVAAEKMNNFNGRIEELKGAVETAQISLGTALIPILTQITAAIQGAVDWFNNLSPAMQQTISISLAVGTALLGIVAAIGIILTVIGGAVTGFGALAGVFATVSGAIAAAGGVMAILTGPVGIAIAAIAALVAAGIWLYKNWDTVSEVLETTWNGIKVVATTVWEAIKTVTINVWTSISSTLMTFWNSIKDGVLKIWDGIKIYFEGAWQVIKNIFLGSLLILTDLITGDFDGMRKHITLVWENIKDGLGKMWEGIKLIFTGALIFIRDYIVFIFERIVTILTIVGTNILNRMITIKDNIVNTVKSINLMEIGKNVMEGFLSGITSMASRIWDKVQSIAEGVKNTIASALKIQSPSRVMMELGEYTAEGFALGMTRTTNKVASAAGKLADVALPEIKGVGGSSVQVVVTGNNIQSPADENRLADKISRKVAQQFGLSVGGAF